MTDGRRWRDELWDGVRPVGGSAGEQEWVRSTQATGKT